jgi:hypothetical protein
MIHVPGLSLDGRLGQDVIQLARNAIGLSLAMEKHAGKFFGNGAIPGGILTVPAALKGDQAQKLKNSWAEAQGGENTHRTAVLENGITYSKIGATPNEAQMVEARAKQKAEVACIYHVPLTMLGEMGATRANAEQIGLEFVNYTLTPPKVAFEHEFKRKLLPSPPLGRNAAKVFFIKIDTRQFTLPDATAKKNFYAAGKQWGFLNSNDIREIEDFNPIEDGTGEHYWMPVNMVVAGEKPEEPEPDPNAPPAASKTDPAAPDADKSQNQMTKMGNALRAQARAYALFGRQFRDAMGRAATRDKLDVKTMARIFEPVCEGTARFLLEIETDDLPAQANEAIKLYISGLAGRSSEWAPEVLERQAVGELYRFTEILRMEA